MRLPVIVIAATIIACGDDHTAATDAGADSADAPRLPGGCWPNAVVSTSGSATLGTGRGGFEAMPDVLPLEYGAQDGYNLVANVRMTGITPGNPKDLLDPGNPRTRIRAFFDDTNIPLNYTAKCPFRNGYVPSAGGDYELKSGVAVVFETCWRSGNLIGRRIRIELDLKDDRGNYAHDVKIVTAGPPPGGDYPIENGTPGCLHIPHIPKDDLLREDF